MVCSLVLEHYCTALLECFDTESLEPGEIFATSKATANKQTREEPVCTLGVSPSLALLYTLVWNDLFNDNHALIIIIIITIIIDRSYNIYSDLLSSNLGTLRHCCLGTWLQTSLCTVRHIWKWSKFIAMINHDFTMIMKTFLLQKWRRWREFDGKTCLGTFRHCSCCSVSHFSIGTVWQSCLRWSL